MLVVVVVVVVVVLLLLALLLALLLLLLLLLVVVRDAPHPAQVGTLHRPPPGPHNRRLQHARQQRPLSAELWG